MKRHLSIYIISVLLVVFMASCGRGKKGKIQTDKDVIQTTATTGNNQSQEYHDTSKNSPDNAHNSSNSLDVHGQYKGMIITSECAMVKTQLILEDNNNFILITENMEENAPRGIFRTDGKYSWNKAGNIIILDIKDQPLKFEVGENILYFLNQYEQRISNKYTKTYNLHKSI